MDIEKLKNYLVSLNIDPEMSEHLPVGGWQAVEALWPLLDAFRKHYEVLQMVTYDKRLERKADKAIDAYVAAGDDSPWNKLAANVLRVLCERTIQYMTVCLANEVQGNPVCYLPPSLNRTQQRCALMLFALSQMSLPFPVAQKGGLVIPEGDVPAPELLQ